MKSSARETGDTYTVNCLFKHSIVSLHLCKEYLTAVKIQNTFRTPDKVVNVLVYGALHCDEIEYV